MKNETRDTNNPAAVTPAASAKPWWDGTFILALGEREKNTLDRTGLIYRPFASENGKLVAEFTLIDGETSLPTMPHRIFSLESLTSSMDPDRAGSRIFATYDGARDFATIAKATLLDEQMTQAQRAEVKALNADTKATARKPAAKAPAKPVRIKRAAKVAA